jgi:hypothetical protein
MKQILEQKFWSNVDKNGPIPTHAPKLGRCWMWTGCDSANGYGRFNIGSTHSQAHRWIYEQINGSIGDLDCCHHCDNRKCVRPSHLFAGTRMDNMRDCSEKGRFFKQGLTHCKHGHLFDEENTRIRTDGNRQCRKCAQLAGYAYRAKLKQQAKL